MYAQATSAPPKTPKQPSICGVLTKQKVQFVSTAKQALSFVHLLRKYFLLKFIVFFVLYAPESKRIISVFRLCHALSCHFFVLRSHFSKSCRIYAFAHVLVNYIFFFSLSSTLFKVFSFTTKFVNFA